MAQSIAPPASGQLTDLAAAINGAHKACVSAQLNALELALACGQLGQAAKEKLKHGEFLPWIDKQTDVGRRTMQLYMEIADKWPQIEAKAQSAAHLSLAAALRLLADDRRSLRLEQAQQVIDVAGMDVAFDMVGEKPTLSAATVKKLAKLPPEKIKRATRFDISDYSRGYNAKNFLKRCKMPEDEAATLEESSTVAAPANEADTCPTCGAAERTEHGDCASCFEPLQELAAQPAEPEHTIAERGSCKIFRGSDSDDFSGLDAAFNLWGVVTDELRDWPPGLRGLAVKSLLDIAKQIGEGG